MSSTDPVTLMTEESLKEETTTEESGIVAQLPKPTPEQAAEGQLNALRQLRNLRLSECDWTQLVDSDLTDEQKAKWQTYRQRLRDVTKHFKTRSEVEWPELDQEKWPTTS